MRLTVPFVALCAAPSAIGFILPDSFKDLAHGKLDPESTHSKDYDHILGLSDKHEEHDHGLAKHKLKTHKHKHKHLHPHEHIHHDYHKHPIKPCHILTTERTCKDFHGLTDEVEKVIHVVQTRDCGNDEHCWHEVVKYIYGLEHSLDLYDKHIDKTTLRKCFNCDQEAIIVECYYDYADALIRLLKVIKHKSKYLEGEVDRPVLTAINSLRVANYALTYEFGRRINCKETLNDIMEKQGANDGSTKGSIQQAFEKDTVFQDKNTYSQGLSNDYYFEEPPRGYRGNCPAQPQREEDRRLEWQKNNPLPLYGDVVFQPREDHRQNYRQNYRQSYPETYSASCPERFPERYPQSYSGNYPERDHAPEWFSPERSPYNHYHDSHGRD
ncbi:hypothetical protein HG530_007277 [Fusarium avenaceum]|nr:hypothetical protein HG530_007277 [Fusarium avenaceum]